MFTFDDYKLRAATEADRELCQRWIDGDDDHRGRVTPEFFLENVAGEAEGMVLEDKSGEPVFFFKVTRPLRVSIQFGPATNRKEKMMNARALDHGMKWLMEMCREAGAREVIFDSSVPDLRKFCADRFGFQPSPNELVCGITTPATEKAVTEPLHHEPQPTEQAR